MARPESYRWFARSVCTLAAGLAVTGSAGRVLAQQSPPAATPEAAAPTAQQEESATGIKTIAVQAAPSTQRVESASEIKTIAVPVVMEEATVRGKVAVLETRREDRKLIEGLPIQVWSTVERQHTSRVLFTTKTHSTYERDQLLRETKTDDLGLFDLPQLTAGEYILVISEVQFRLSVVPQSQQRRGQAEPKVLLILIPKEVVARETSNPDAK